MIVCAVPVGMLSESSSTVKTCQKLTDGNHSQHDLHQDIMLGIIILIPALMV